MFQNTSNSTMSDNQECLDYHMAPIDGCSLEQTQQNSIMCPNQCLDYGYMTPQKGQYRTSPVEAPQFLTREQSSTSAETAASSPNNFNTSRDTDSFKASLDSIQIGRTLGRGASCKVKVAQDCFGKRFAMKILNPDKRFRRFIKAEVESLSMIKHPHIVNIIEHGEGVRGEAEQPFEYILLELAANGSMFEYVAKAGRFDEVYARHFFAQLMSGINYLHSAGLVHRDLKPENLLFDDCFNLKIADFGFAELIEGSDGDGKLTGKLGTAGYMAPEINLGETYNGQSVDLFASGVILFTLLTRRVPFEKAHPSDPHYYYLVTDPQSFWRSHAEAEEDGENIYSDEFKDLFEKLMSFDTRLRPTLDEVLCHPFMLGQFPSAAQVFEHFSQRRLVMKASETGKTQ